jgi:hypothetical protein
VRPTVLCEDSRRPAEHPFSMPGLRHFPPGTMTCISADSDVIPPFRPTSQSYNPIARCAQFVVCPLAIVIILEGEMEP